MLFLENILQRFIEKSDFLKNLILGSLLSFIPIINIFAFGYLYRFSKNLNVLDKEEFPGWKDFGKLFVQGCIFLGIAFVYIGIPLGLSIALSFLIFAFGGSLLGILGYLSFIPTSLAVLVCPYFFIAGLAHFQKHKQLSCCFDFIFLFKYLLSIWPKILIGTLFSLGFLMISLPIYGAAFFISLAFLIYYYSIISKSINHNL